jgi:TolB-like protein
VFVFLSLLVAAMAAQAGGELRIAVLDFSGAAAASEMAALGAGLQSMITTDLAQVSSLVVVERARLAEVQRELKLSRSKQVDPATAVRIGKLAGASHLVTGSYTVVQGKMRLDGRLVSVASGKVILAESAEGEKDAFFELEKGLVNKLIGAIGVKLAAKERGAVAKIHTTDFEAFKQFSSGVILFDEQRYDESAKTLRAALSRDADFKLARTTLSEYERVVAELRAKAANIEAAESESKRAAVQEADAEEYKVLQKLLALAFDDKPKSRLIRASASYQLACAYKSSRRSGIPGFDDRFINEQNAAALARRYHADMLVLYPRAALYPHCYSQIGPDHPRSMESFDREFEGITERLGATWGNDDTTRRVYAAAQLLHLDVHGEAELGDQYYELMLEKGGVDARVQRELLERRAGMRRALLEFDQSTRLLKQASELPEAKNVIVHGGPAGQLRYYATLIEQNLALARRLGGEGKDSRLREFAQLRSATLHYAPGDLDDKDLAKFVALPQDRADAYLTTLRRVSDYVFVGPLLAFRLQGELYTGPRTLDARRASELRYHDAGVRRSQPAVVVLEDSPRTDLRANFELGFVPSADFLPRDIEKGTGRPLAARPGVLFMFHARCLECTKPVPTTDGGYTNADQPTEALALSFEPNRVRLVRMSLPPGGRQPPQLTLLSEHASDGAGASKLAVKVRIQGAAVTVNVGGKDVSISLPDKRQSGFSGFVLHGPGFVSLSKLELGPL